MLRFSARRLFVCLLLSSIGTVDAALAQDRRGDTDTSTCAGHSYEEAIAACTRLLSSRSLTDRARARTHTSRGIAYRHTGKYDAAIKDFDIAIQLAPKIARAYTARGWTYYYKGDLDRTQADADKLISLNGDVASGYDLRAAVLADRGDYLGALNASDNAIRLRPDDPILYSNRCARKIAADQLKEAWADCDKSVQLDPKRTQAHTFIGIVYLKIGQPDDAIKEFNTVLSNKSPEGRVNAYALYGRGLAKLALGDSAGNADVAEADALDPVIARRYAARYRLTPGGEARR
jgi:tetratricopeptide (TPR) repeat protein